MFFGNAEISIENIVNDTLFTTPTIEFDIEVKYGDTSFFNFFKKLSGVEILVDSTIVAKRSSFLGLPKIFGNDKYKVDLAGFADGQHRIQAKGYTGFRIFGRSVFSATISFTIDRSLCDPDKSFILFTGHNEVTSVMAGQVNITWPPGFVVEIDDTNFIWCGEFTYNVFVAEGEYDFSAANVTGPKLIELADADTSISRYETSSLTLVVSNLQVGANYSFLVMAKTETGHFSDNREGTSIEISTLDVKVKSDFTRLVNIPESTDVYQVLNNKIDFIVSFTGELPTEVLSLQSLDFIYFFDVDGNATLGRCTNKVDANAGNTSVSWQYQLSEFSDMFDELDLSTEYTEGGSDEESDDDTDEFDDIDPEIEEQLDAAFNRLNENVKRNLCIYAFPGNDGTICEDDDVDDRRLRKCGKGCRRRRRRRRRLFGWLVSAAEEVRDFVVDTGVAIGNTVVNFVKREKTFTKYKTLLKVDRNARLTTSDSGLDLGLKYFLSARARVRITVSVAKGIKRASLQLKGQFTFEAYLALLPSSPRRYQPPPLLVFRDSDTKGIVLPLPSLVLPIIIIIIKSEPKVYATVEIVAATEGQANAVVKVGYDYIYEYSYDKSRKDEFQQNFTLVPSPRVSRETKFSLRLLAYAELGAILHWNVFLNSILQASAAVDIGFRPELQVGTNADALVVTFPYFYTLDKLGVNMFIRARALVGLNNAVFRIFRKIAAPVVDPSYSFRTTRRLSIPDVVLGPNNIPSPLQLAINQAQNSLLYRNATSISLEQLNALVPDPFPETIGTPIQGLDLDFGLKWQLFNDDFLLIGVPKIQLAASGTPQLCQGSDAIILTVKTKTSRAIIPFRNGLRGGFWYANFDGRIFQEDTAWVLDPVRTNTDSITMRLPRSAINRPDFTSFEISDKASIILRATPEILPLPERSMFVKADLKSLFNIAKFDCCDNSDCSGADSCYDRICGQIIVQ